MTEYVTKEAFEKFKAEDFAQVRQDLTLLTVKVDTLTTEVAALPTTSDVKVLIHEAFKEARGTAISLGGDDCGHHGDDHCRLVVCIILLRRRWFMMAEYVTKEAFEKFKAEDFAQVQQDLTVLTVKVDNLDDKLNTLSAAVVALPTTSHVKALIHETFKEARGTAISLGVMIAVITGTIIAILSFVFSIYVGH
ncbi:hypothetical protein [Weissella cibaria]|nr:hypothetical protein [Weissella cibaria]